MYISDTAKNAIRLRQIDLALRPPIDQFALLDFRKYNCVVFGETRHLSADTKRSQKSDTPMRRLALK